MKNTTLVITFLSAVLFATVSASGQTASQGPDNDKSEPKTTAQDVKDYTFAEKAKFTEKMKRQLAAINRDIDQLDAKIAKEGAEAKAEAEPKLHALRVKARQLDKKIEEAKDATESDWDRVKTDSKRAYDKLKDGVNRAHSWVGDKLSS